MKLKLLLTALVFLSFTSTGCMYLILKGIQSTNPTYEESLGMMNEIPQNYGRLFIYVNQAKNDLPKVAGCKVFRIFNDVNDPCTFTLVETWASETDHKKNIESMVASGFWGHLATHLACDPTSGYYKEL